jgi:hypothetical protein
MLLCNEDALVTSDLTTPELMVIWGDDILHKYHFAARKAHRALKQTITVSRVDNFIQGQYITEMAKQIIRFDGGPKTRRFLLSDFNKSE